LSDTPSNQQDFKTAIYDMLIESQHWSKDQMLAFQRSQLEQLLRHAKVNVPFYESRLDCMFTAHGEIDWRQWGNVPILTRQDVAENFDALQSKTLPPGHGKTKAASTSGSTGLPIKATYSKLLSDVCIAADWRAHNNWGFDWSQPAMYWQKYDEHHQRHGPLHNYGMWGPPHLEISQKGKSFAIDTGLSVEECLKNLRNVDSQFLFAQGNLPFSAAMNMQDSSETFPLKGIASHGVELDAQMASVLKSVFGAHVSAMYSSKEGGRMAHTCAQCQQYHVNDDCVLLEILDANNQPCAIGVPGRVVVTAFFNAAQPFIRYEQGDIATWAASCPCGTNRPTLASIDGRVYHLFKRRNGERFAPFVFDGHREQLCAQFWQFVQTSQNCIVVKYKPEVRRNAEQERQFGKMLREHLQEDYVIEFQEISELPLTASGKFVKYVFAAQ
jgi:phenylacetate-CoA ligase